MSGISTTAALAFLAVVALATYVAAQNHSSAVQQVYDFITMAWDSGRAILAVVFVAFAVGTGEPTLILFAGIIAAFAVMFLVYDFYSPLNGRYR